MTADERIIALVKPEYLDMVPSFCRQHATERVCYLVARDFPDLYEAFSAEAEPDAENLHRMTGIANDVFMERLDRRRTLGDLGYGARSEGRI